MCAFRTRWGGAAVDVDTVDRVSASAKGKMYASRRTEGEKHGLGRVDSELGGRRLKNISSRPSVGRFVIVLGSRFHLKRAVESVIDFITGWSSSGGDIQCELVTGTPPFVRFNEQPRMDTDT